MCGITGIWHLDKRPLTEKKLEVFNDSLSHRGPDGFGLYIEKNIGLGHRRLAILDLSEKGKQPMSYAKERYWITFNGEIFNFIELKKELVSFGYSFLSDTDTEIILAAYIEWGEKCLEKFNGMWALAIWDKEERKLFLARDRFGVKPLYYFIDPGKVFAFASETIAFKNLEGFKRNVDEKKLAIEMHFPFSVDGYGHTIYKDIYKILPGHFAKIFENSSEVVQKRWWGTLENLDQDIPNSYEERVAKFKWLFEDSCKIRMRSDVPIGTALSGGLDSSSIYSMINHLMKTDLNKERTPTDWQRAFVATFPGTSLDEKKYADMVIRKVGGKAIYIVPSAKDIIDKIKKTTLLFDSIYASPISVISEVYAKMRESGVRVSLDGHGADEMLFGYKSMLRSACKYLNTTNKKELLGAFGENYFPNQNSVHLTEWLKYRVPILSKNLLKIKHIFDKTGDQLKYLGEKETDADELNELDKLTYEAFHLRTLPTILRNFDRASMQNGIEVRMPFMDWRLVTFIFALPFKDKVKNGVNKYILRDSMKEILPEEIRTRTSKIGFNAPMVEWFSGPLKEFIIDISNSKLFEEIAGVDSQKIKKMIQNDTQKGWSWKDCSVVWPYLNAVILLDQ